MQLRELDSLFNERISLIEMNKEWSPSSPYLIYNRFLYLPTDVLIAIAVVLCGALGSITASVRVNNKRYSSVILTGILAGFIAFLVVKGGRFLFFIESGSSDLAFVNPYAVAFSGVLAGLFTEKAFGVLSGWVDEIGDRLTKKDGPNVPLKPPTDENEQQLQRGGKPSDQRGAELPAAITTSRRKSSANTKTFVRAEIVDEGVTAGDGNGHYKDATHEQRREGI